MVDVDADVDGVCGVRGDGNVRTGTRMEWDEN